MAISGNGREYDVTFLADSSLQTSTAAGGNGTMQYRVVGFAPGTTTAADRTVGIAGGTGTMAEPTAPAAHCLGINQTMMSCLSTECSVRMLGVSKAVCAESVGAGYPVAAYGAIGGGASTTTMKGRIIQVDLAVSCTAYGATVSSNFYILGRALESGSTGTVISVFVNPTLHDRQLAGTVTTT